MRRLSVYLMLAVCAAGSAQAGGRLAKLLSRNEMEHGPLRSQPAGVKLLELELVQSPGARQIADEFTTLQFRVRQLNNPDPQYVPPPIRLRRYSLSGAQLEQAWLHPNGEGIYQTSVPMQEARHHYFYFETGSNRTILKKVPWVVLKSVQLER